MSGDSVEVSVFSSYKSRRLEGEIINVVERNTNQFVGKLDISKNFAFVSIKNPKISISIRKEESNCIIIISDNAQGIEKEIINRIFEPYVTTKDKYHGTGLGLYMLQNLLTRQLQGDIKVENINCEEPKDEKCGASFKLTIPINI